ncbi:MAG: N-acetylmuramoyl-L-alanine amidase [Rhodospirillales bacterium]|nr:MAG: N-acetylmuramoyl-L-alanine amidase [Rhodospirillales bacterium]
MGIAGRLPRSRCFAIEKPQKMAVNQGRVYHRTGIRSRSLKGAALLKDRHVGMNASPRRLWRPSVWIVAAWFVALVLQGAAAPAAAQGALSILDARIARHDAATRVVLETSGKVAYEIFALEAPCRIVVDLTEARWTLRERNFPVADPLISRLRYGVFKPGTSRVVLECRKPVGVDDAVLIEPRDGNGYRLVIDLVEVPPILFAQYLRSPVRPAMLPARLSPPQPEFAPEVTTVPAASPGAVRFVRPAWKPPLAPRRPVIVVDPGHGGADPGAISRTGVYEKHVTLQAARLLRQELQTLGRFDVVLTRDEDRFIRLRDRVAAARAADAAMFISLHADTNPDPAVRGVSVYTLSERASDAEAAALAERENRADLISGVDLSHEAPEVATILINLAQRETMNQSAQLATVLVRELGRETRLLRNTHRFAGFAVLKAPDVPSVLVELGHLSNAEDARRLQQEAYLRRLVRAIARGVDAYFGSVVQAQR